MNRIVSLLMLLVCVQGFAQASREEFKEKYDRQVRNLGYAGVGVETILDKWEEAFPEDMEAKMARFYLYLNRNKVVEMVRKDQDKFLGASPSVTFKDENGNPVYYYEETFYEDHSFEESQIYIDSLIKSYPEVLDFRIAKINSLFELEKESPELAFASLLQMSGLYKSSGSGLTVGGEKVDADTFIEIIQEYCVMLYSIKNNYCFECFYNLSVKMAKEFPSYPGFLDNQGSYWLVVKNQPKKAIQFYDKALKLDPKDVVALRNKQVAQRYIANSKKK